jgi:hypothetical protein
MIYRERAARASAYSGAFRSLTAWVRPSARAANREREGNSIGELVSAGHPLGNRIGAPAY